jgi:hypothetical protein
VSLLIACGLNGADRRRIAVAAAARIATPGEPAGCLVIERGRADGYALSSVTNGETSAPADFISACGEVAVAALDGAGDLGLAAGRTIFLTGPDIEELLETYRGLKSWRATRTDRQASAAAIFVVGAAGGEEARKVHHRLAAVARQCLGLELADAGFMPPSSAADVAAVRRVFSDAPAAEILPRLSATTQPAGDTGGLPASADDQSLPASESPNDNTTSLTAPLVKCSDPIDQGRPDQPASAKQDDAEYRVFSPWSPESREALIAAVEAQGPAIEPGSFQQLFRIEVDEPGAPPLAAVRADGTLVAVLVTAPGESPDAPAACRWLAMHRKLLMRAYPCSGISADVEPSAIVLAPAGAPAVADGVRRYVAVRTGGHRGIVVLP